MNRNRKRSIWHWAATFVAIVLVIWLPDHTLLGFVEEEHHFPRNIFEAARSGSTWQISRYLAKGADVNDRQLGYTPLMQAATRGKLPAAEYLIAKGADVNAKYYDETALRSALRRKNLRMVELLLDHGAKVNEKGEDGFTPLLLVLAPSWMGRNADLVEVLVEHGADVNERDKYKSSPLAYAEKYNWEDITAYLRAHGAKP